MRAEPLPVRMKLLSPTMAACGAAFLALANAIAIAQPTTGQEPQTQPAIEGVGWATYTFEHHFQYGILGPVLFVAGILLAILVSSPLRSWLDRLASRTLTRVDDALSNAFVNTVWVGLVLAGTLAWLYFWTHYFTGGNAPIVHTVGQTALVLLGLYAAWHLIDALGEWVRELTQRTKTQLDDVLAAIARRVLKVVVILIALGVLIDVFGGSAFGFFVGLGILSVIAFIAGFDAVRSFSGSIQLLAENPFDLGDVILVDGIVGTVKHVGLRSTRIETPERTDMWVPNRHLLSRPVENLSTRRSRRQSFTLDLGSDTASEALEKVIAAIREILDFEDAVVKRRARTDAAGEPIRTDTGALIFEGVDPLVTFEGISRGAFHLLVQYDLSELAFPKAAEIHQRLLLKILSTLEVHEVKLADAPADETDAKAPAAPAKKAAGKAKRAPKSKAKSKAGKTSKKSRPATPSGDEDGDAAGDDDEDAGEKASATTDNATDAT